MQTRMGNESPILDLCCSEGITGSRGDGEIVDNAPHSDLR
jgi:hypothetical protein